MDEEKKKRNKVTIGTAIIIVSIVIGLVFYNSSPCSESCIGCGSWVEQITDMWSYYVMLMFLFVGLIIIETSL